MKAPKSENLENLEIVKVEVSEITTCTKWEFTTLSVRIIQQPYQILISSYWKLTCRFWYISNYKNRYISFKFNKNKNW